MPKKNKKQNNPIEEILYCSLDIETSDFDPANGEILELGMIFFHIEEKQFKLKSEWTCTFKPSKEVAPRILALTGITNEELEDSVKFAEKKDQIQELLKDAVIVGHNIVFDIRFMEAFGIKFSGRKLDTLDLAQIFLPTNSSYNLEALMSFFDIHYKDAHRALADARATIAVLEKILIRLGNLSEQVKESLKEIFSKGDPEIAALFQTNFSLPQPETPVIRAAFKKIEIANSLEVQKAINANNSIVTFPLGFNYYRYVYGALAKQKEKVLLVVPNSKILYGIWQNDIATPIFEQKDYFVPEKFKKNLKKVNSKTANFLAKILVWQATNWQSEALIDLNLSFFGNQFKALISNDSKGSEAIADSKDKIVVVDYFTFINNDFSNLAKRKVVILDISNFESTLTYVSSKKVSWGDFIYNFKQLYDPATDYGALEYKKIVVQALSDVDLFFGLASLNFSKLQNESPNILVDAKIESTPEYATIKSAATGFVEKLRKINSEIESERINNYIESLLTFFGNEPNLIRWVEIFEGRLTFFVSPLNLEKISAEKIGAFKKMIFTASLGADALIKYFAKRLGVIDFSTASIGQQELRQKFLVKIQPELNTPEKILELAEHLQYPAAILLPSMTAVKEFYENNFKTLQKYAKVFVQGFTGGTNKLLENFSIQPQSLLIATDKFILKQFGRHLQVKDLVITRLPFEQFNHPLLAVQAEQYANKFEEFSIPRTLYNFHSIIGFFYGNDLQRIFILDQKIRKEYGKYFIDYLNSLPFVEIE